MKVQKLEGIKKLADQIVKSESKSTSDACAHQIIQTADELAAELEEIRLKACEVAGYPDTEQHF